MSIQKMSLLSHTNNSVNPAAKTAPKPNRYLGHETCLPGKFVFLGKKNGPQFWNNLLWAVFSHLFLHISEPEGHCSHS